MKVFKSLVWVIALVFLAVGCAKRGTITGGEKDIAPPKIISSLPKNLSTNFNQKLIKITFDEFVKVKDVQKNLIVSPPFTNPVTVLPQGSVSKTITIKINDTLVPNTTYSLNFGESISDNNEGNVLKNFKYVFATGNQVDSLTVEGIIKDSYEKKTDNYVNVMLYEVDEKFNDSTIYKQKPRYITNTLDSSTTFKIENIKAGKYKLVALKEKSTNYKFDANKDKIGFYNQIITVPDKSIFELELFKEDPKFNVKKPVQVSGNRVLIPYEGNAKNLVINPKYKEANLPHKITKLANKDSLQLWFQPIKNDSILVIAENDNYSKNFVVKLRNLKQDTLKLATENNSLGLKDALKINVSVPAVKFDFSKMSLIKKDSSQVVFKTNYDEMTQNLEVVFDKEENQKYTFQMQPNAVEDYLGRKNDSIIRFAATTKSRAEYGNLKLVFLNAKSFPLIVELTDDKGVIAYTEYVEKNPTLEFLLIEPKKYSVRVIYDTNKNKQRDTGNYLENLQPEEVVHFLTEIDVRANWDVNQDIDLSK